MKKLIVQQPPITKEIQSPIVTFVKIIFCLSMAMAYLLMHCVNQADFNIHITTSIYLVPTVIQTIYSNSITVPINNNNIQLSTTIQTINWCYPNSNSIVVPNNNSKSQINPCYVNINKRGLLQQSNPSFTLHTQDVPVLRPTTLPSDKQQLKEIKLSIQLMQYLVSMLLLLMQLFQQLFIQLSYHFFVCLVASVTCVGGV